MNLLDFYYFIKPLIPRRVQLALRRKIVRRKLEKVRGVWPIDPEAGKPPVGWQGWPEEKQFALVLTHDVETAEGLAKVRLLAELEMKLGFRSCFNFVPGDYPVPRELRGFLTGNGFEVGVHGYTHKKGNPFKSNDIFSKQALWINRFLKEWGAVGFRAPSMYHDLEKINLLNIAYDASTFDTDPFEPQPDGVGTIFPFWAPNRNGGDLVELPSTLPQDSTLFLIMQEKDNQIWKQKLDWIAQQGGMALLNTHPDYIGFIAREPNFIEYPYQYYETFLLYAKDRYKGFYWHCLPRELAEFTRIQVINSKSEIPNLKHQAFIPQAIPQASQIDAQTAVPPSVLIPQSSPTLRRLRVCMLSYSFYEVDARVTRYAETLARRGDHVDVISIGREGMEGYSLMNGVHVYRVQKRKRDERGKMVYLSRVLKFLVKSSACLNKKHRTQPYDLIHIHSLPDFEVFAAWLPKLKGAKIILDIHDVVPEFYTAKFGTSQGTIFYKLLILTERLSASFSHEVIISNHIWKKTLERSVRGGKCSIILNFPDDLIYFRRPRQRSDGKFIMMYPGTLNWHQGLDIAVRAMARIKNDAPSAELHIYGSGNAQESLETLAEELDVSDRIIFYEPRPKEEIAAVMAEADLGLVPKRDDSFGGEAFSTKTLEFMSLGVPLLLSATKIDRYYFNDSVVRFFEPENVDDLAEKIVELYNSPEQRQTLAANALEFVEQYKWKNNKHLYLDLVDSLVGNKSEIQINQSTK